MPSDDTSNGNDYGSVVRKCPFDGCGWQIEVGKMSPEDETARRDAEHRAELHFDREHRGTARVKVVLEREVSVHPGQDIQEIVDHHHDTLSDDTPAGYEVAYAVGEYIEEPDDSEEESA